MGTGTTQSTGQHTDGPGDHLWGQRSTDEDLPLHPTLTLTEEELLVLTDGSPGVVPARVQEPEDPAAADLVRSVALRGLMARGLVLPSGATPDGVAWEVAEPLGLALQLRALAPTVLGLQRALGPLASDRATRAGDQIQPGRAGGEVEAEGTSAVRYLHLHEEIAVIEDVTDDGMHSLLTVFPERYREAVADFIRPPDAVAGQGRVRRLEDSVEELLEALGAPTVLVEASLVTGIGAAGAPPAPAGQMLTLGPGGTFRSHDSHTYHPVDPDGAIADLLREALAGGAVGG